MKIRMAVMYTAALSSITLFFGLWELISYFGAKFSQFLTFSIVLAFVPLLYSRKIQDFLMVFVFTTLALGIMLIAPSCIAPSGNIMHSLVLLLITSLLVVSIKDSLNLLYSGLSFYLVGVFLLLAYVGINLIIIMAQIADYYIGCIGMACASPPVSITPAMILFIMAIPATYPYFQKFQFRRDIYDKESP